MLLNCLHLIPLLDFQVIAALKEFLQSVDAYSRSSQVAENDKERIKELQSKYSMEIFPGLHLDFIALFSQQGTCSA